MHSPFTGSHGPHAALPPWGHELHALMPPGPFQMAFHPCLLWPPFVDHSMRSSSPVSGQFTEPGAGPWLTFSPSIQNAGHIPDCGRPARSACGSRSRTSR
jgi:hypothetical protein